MRKDFHILKENHKLIIMVLKLQKGMTAQISRVQHLCVWAIVMILHNNESLESRYNLIKP